MVALAAEADEVALPSAENCDFELLRPDVAHRRFRISCDIRNTTDAPIVDVTLSIRLTEDGQQTPWVDGLERIEFGTSGLQPGETRPVTFSAQDFDEIRFRYPWPIHPAQVSLSALVTDAAE